MKFKWSEVFYSIQGEGLRVGKPSVFIRFFGCNLKCQGFGKSLGELSNEYKDIDPNDYTKFNELPLVTTGCDSYGSWDPRGKHLMQEGTAEDLIEEIKKALGITGDDTVTNWLQGIDIVITGGEPLLGWQKGYPSLFDKLLQAGVDTITFETNGTKAVTPKFKEYLESRESAAAKRLVWSISPKLSNSGEDQDKTLNPKVVKSMTEISHSTSYFKFVVRSGMEHDVKEAIKILESEVTVYVMPEGGLNEEYNGNSFDIATMAMKNKWRYSPRLQLDLFGNKWGT